LINNQTYFKSTLKRFLSFFPLSEWILWIKGG
jgi:hypothetical protein